SASAALSRDGGSTELCLGATTAPDGRVGQRHRACLAAESGTAGGGTRDRLGRRPGHCVSVRRDVVGAGGGALDGARGGRAMAVVGRAVVPGPASSRATCGVPPRALPLGHSCLRLACRTDRRG